MIKQERKNTNLPSLNHKGSLLHKYADYLLVFFFIIISSGANILSGKISVVLFFFLFLSVYIYRGYFLDRPFVFVLLFVFLTSIVFYLKNNQLNYITISGFFLRFSIAAMLVVMLKRRFLFLFTDVVYYLALISIPLYIIQLFAPQFFLDLYSFTKYFHDGDSKFINFIVFTFYGKHKYRNCGFMWEPGAFAAVVSVALIISLLLKSQKKKKNIVLLIALLSTMSTMGYLTLIFHFFVISSKVKYKFILVPIFVISLFYISQLNFVANKTENQFANVESEIKSAKKNKSTKVIGLSRFASIYADWPVYKANFLVGLGIDYQTISAKQYYNKFGQQANRACGSMMILMSFGLVGFLLYYFGVYKSFVMFFGKKGGIIVLCVVFITLFSNPLQFTPLYLSFSILFLTKKKKNLV